MVKSTVWKSIKYSYGTALIPAFLVFVFRLKIASFFFKNQYSQEILGKSLILAAFQIPIDFSIPLLISLFM